MGELLNIVEKQITQCAGALPNAELMRFAFDRLGDGVIWFGRDGRVLYANEAACRFLEYTRAELLDCRVANFAPGFNDEMWCAHWQKAEALETVNLETLYCSKSGRKFIVALTVNYFEYGGNEFICTIVRDISARKQMEESMRLAESIYKSSNEAVMVTDENNRIVAINPAFTRITDYTLDELYGKSPGVLRSNLHDAAFYQEMWKDIHDIGYWQGEMWDRRRSGEFFASYVTISLIRNPDGSIFRYVAQFLEITEKKRRDEQIWQHANYDALTSLPNRRLFHDRLAQEIKKSNRTGHPLALLFIDLDGFKQINDRFGHDKGDMLLVEVARRIEKCVRETDTVARLGGDEFTVILPNYGSCTDVERIALSVIHELSAPFLLQDETGLISASVGIALYPDDARDVEELLKCADQAMYAAKQKGRSRYTHVAKPSLLGNARNSYFKRRSIYFEQSAE